MRFSLATALFLVLALPVVAGHTPSGPAQPSTPKQPDAGAKDDFEKRLEEIDERAKGTKTLRARFEQKKHTPLLKKPLESKGTVVIKGDKTRWETVEPHRSTMTIDDKGLRIFYPDQQILEIYELGGDVREFSGSPLPRLEKLRKSFAIAQVKASELGGRDDDAKALGVELLPRAEELKKHVARVRVLIDITAPAVSRIEIEDVDEERTVVEFKDVELNKEVEDAEVTLVVPSGTREVHPLGKQEQKPKEEAK